MNRILELNAPTKTNTLSHLKNFSPAKDNWDFDCEVPIGLIGPLHYEPGYAYPLVVWLHSPGGNEREIHKVMPLISVRNYVGVAPRGTDPTPDSPGYCWRQTGESIDHCELAVFDSIEVASQRYNVRSDRIFLAGFGTGGTMAMRIGLRNPTRFAGVISIGGPFPSGFNPLTKIQAIRQLPMFIGLGREAEKYTAEKLCRELRLFHAAALKVDLRLYPAADELTTQMLHDLDQWIMQHVPGSTGCSQSDLPASLGE
jgi:phospholipase/carboxylesterase